MNSKEIKEKVFDGYVHFSAIIEMVGKPKEHVDKTLKDYVGTLKGKKEMEVIKQEFSETKEVEGTMFSAFAEVEMLVKGTGGIVDFCFDYMPSSIEIIDPETLKYSSHEFTGFLNDLQARLHEFDMAVKTVNETNKKLNTNTEVLLKNAIKLAIRSGKKTLKDISMSLGIAEENLKTIMTALEESNLVSKQGDEYSLLKKS